MNKNTDRMVAIITGAASGLGLAIAKKHAESNIRLALFDKNKEQLLHTQLQIAGETIISEVDVVKELEVKNAIENVAKKLGGILNKQCRHYRHHQYKKP